ncbi:MAG: cobyric acid synthase [Geminicoccaceae bacterium]|nr:cobyric acid synthase [Geminicoccaceae bacterium]
MLQGTSSDAGKSLLVAGLCRAYARRGLRVRPFKPQNMSNNAAATPDGGEIGRAQALQAQAAGVPPSRDMNPVLLKPESERGAQVVVRGEAIGTCAARDYHALKPRLMGGVLESFRRLQAEADLVLVEGAGSPAEVNLRDGDIANMGFALRANVPVLLAADIERGGVIAQIVGTALLLEPDERALLKGCVVNKFRGDPALFDTAHPIIQERAGIPCLGVVPWFDGARDLPAEDVLGLRSERRDGGIRIVVPRLPRIANFDDLDPLAQEPDVSLEVVESGRPLPQGADLVVLPGSKATVADLEALRREGWDIDILSHRRQGGAVLGLCGGYQMLGCTVADPDGVEGPPATVPGLGLLAVDTVLERTKTVRPASGHDAAGGLPVHGYEIHTGRTTGPDAERPLLRLETGPDGAVSRDGLAAGTYLHGLMAGDAFRSAYLGRLRTGRTGGTAYAERVEAALEGLADHLEDCLDLDGLLRLAK